jgi:Right handed beta helix region
VVSNCEFVDNYVYTAGGAISCRWGASAEINNCTFIQNMAPMGGAMYIQVHSTSSEVQIDNCLFYGNRAKLGGALFNESAAPRIQSCTFVLNESDSAYSGSVLYSVMSPTPEFMGCIISNNYDGTPIVHESESTEPVFSCSNVFGNEHGDWTEDIESQYGINGNISADPLFINLEEGNLSFHPDSPCTSENSGCGSMGSTIQMIDPKWFRITHIRPPRVNTENPPSSFFTAGCSTMHEPR